MTLLLQAFPSRSRVLPFGALLIGLVTASATWAQPVELRQGGAIGSGNAFRRGDQCLILTAAHVVKDASADVEARDRTGARGSGQVRYANIEVDLALVELSAPSAIACSQTWPDATWMSSATWTSRSLLDVVRHDSTTGRETVISLRWAGGTSSSLTLARVDKLGVVESDSGSIVREGERMVGIVRAVDTATDRVEVLRFDAIDRLLGERFRGKAGGGAIAFDGVAWQGRRQAKWSEYISSWMQDVVQRPVLGPNDPNARCAMSVKVLDWGQASVPNPAHPIARKTLEECSSNVLGNLVKGLTRPTCIANAQSALKATSTTVLKHSIQISVEARSRSGTLTTKLRQLEHTSIPQKGTSRSDTELEVLQATFPIIAQEVFSSGVCE